MSAVLHSSTVPPPARPDGLPSGLRRIAGALAAALGAVLVLVGAGAVALQLAATDADGYFTGAEARLGTATYALTSDGIDVDTLDGLSGGIGGTVRVQARPVGDERLFVGIAPRREVERYLGGVARARVAGSAFDGAIARYRERRGGAPLAAPGDRRFWAASSEGTGTRAIEWDVQGGRWSLVVMNADGTRDVRADVSGGVRLPWLLGAGIGAGVLGLVLLGAGGALLAASGARTRVA